MESLKFKTNLNCGSCIKAVSGFIDAVQGVKDWSVDLQHPDKILTVTAEEGIEERIVEAVQDAGFEIVELVKC